MITFSINQSNNSDKYAILVWQTINENLGYFKTFNGERWEEAVHRTYELALRSKDDRYEDIAPYIKKLARTVLKVKTKESAFDIMNEDGDISPVFATLRDYIDTDNVDVINEIKDTFKELYLLDEESFLKLQNLFKYNEVTDIPNMKEIRIKNQKLNDEMFTLVRKHGVELTFGTLSDFLKELPMLISERQTNLTKEVNVKQGNFSVLDKIPDTATIQDSEGNYHYIDKNTLTMEQNPDYLKWDIVGSSVSTCDILKIDISPFMSYMYEEVFVDPGVSTRHIKWCGNKYKVTTPAGAVHIGLDRDKFISVARIELIVNLMMNNIGSVVAISPDNIYIKPIRTFQFDKMRLKFQNGKVIDLPITVHIKKRKSR